MPIIRFNDNETGLTLIEVLASLILLSLLTVSFMAVFTPAALWISKAERVTVASNYAASVLEALRSDRSKIMTGNSGQRAPDLFPAYGYPRGGMSAIITRLEQQNPPYGNLYDITVTVSWQEGTTSRSLQMSTLIKKE